MKKSQILAAIALAFALGVVAPVAGASALTLEEKNADDQVTVHGKASCKEALTAVKYVKENTDYKNILNFRKAVEDLFDITTDKTFRNTGTEYSVIWIDADEATAMVDKLLGNTTSSDIRGNKATYPFSVIKANQDVVTNFGIANTSHIAVTDAMNDALSDFVAEKTYDNTVAVIEAIEGMNGYKEYKAIYDAAKAGKQGDFETAVAAYNKKYTGANLNSNSDTRENLADAIKAIEKNRANDPTINAIGGTQDFKPVFKAFVALFLDMDQAKLELNTYKDARKKLTDAYNVLVSADQILNTPAGNNKNDDYYQYTEAQKTGWTWLVDLIDIVYDMDWAANVKDENRFLNLNTTNVYNAAKWDAVTGAIDDITCTSRTDEGDVYYQQLAPLAVAYKNAAELDKSLTATISMMVKYEPKDPVVVPDESTNPADAPNSGILGTADNSASATISIVAGLATALAALGAGVVAFRSARRSK